jgi:CheY-like chemotaxis protein
MARVLLVDDEVMVRRTLCIMLERGGHEVKEAQDGDEALQIFAELQPDLVIMDIFMPNREGVETIAQLRGAGVDTPVIAISGGDRAGAMMFLDTAKSLGATITLQKPIRSADLLAAVDKCLAP